MKNYPLENYKSYSESTRFRIFMHLMFPGRISGGSVENYIVLANLTLQKESEGKKSNGYYSWYDTRWWDCLKEVRNSQYGENGIHQFDPERANWELFRYMAKEAENNGWWPTRKLAESDGWKKWVHDDLSESAGCEIDPMQAWFVTRAIHALLTDSEEDDLGIPSDAPFPPESVYWTAADWLIDLLKAHAVSSFTFNLRPALFSKFAPVLFDSWFTHQYTPRELLTNVTRAIEISHGKGLDTVAIIALAFCVWANSRTSAAAITRALAPDSPAREFGRLCAAILDGSYNHCTSVFSKFKDAMRTDHLASASTPFWLLGAALALREETPEEAVSPNRPADKLAACMIGRASYAGWHPVGRTGFQNAHKYRKECFELLKRAGSTNFDASTAPHITAYDAQFIPDTLNRIGYATLAAIHMAEIARREITSDELSELAATLKKQGTQKLLKDIAPDPKWKKALRELKSFLPKKPVAEKKVETKAKGVIVWTLELSESNDGPDEFRCSQLTVAFRGPRASDDGRDDKNITLKSLATPKYRECLTEGDEKIIAELQRRNELKGVSCLTVVSSYILECLCGHPYLRQKRGYKATFKPGPITIERRPCEVKTEENENGEMILSIPPRVSRSRSSSILFKEDEDRYHFYPMSHNVANVIDVIKKEGSDDKLVIPKSAIGEAKEVLELMAGVMNVGGKFSATGGNAGFTRVAGDAAPHARLAYANETLNIDLVVAPASDRNIAACAPGEGLAERLVQLRGGKTILLVRDLAAEKSAAENVRTSLAQFEAWQTGKNQWQIADADSSLDALRALKALDGVQLDWPQGEKLRVTAPSANGVSIRASGTDWFEIKGDVKFDDGRVMKLMELLRNLPNRKGNYVRFSDDDYFYLSNELLRRMEALATVVTSGGKRGERNQIVPAALPMLAQAFKDDGEDASLPKLPEELRKRADAIRAAQSAPVELPRRFNGSLRYYQETGYKWLEQLAASGFGACLADDMGLGKTIQIIALLLNRSANGPSLVVAPASVCVNWVREIERFAPSLHAVTLWGEKSLPAGLGAGDVIVSSYGLLVSRDDEFTAVEWNGVVLDEAQAVKNASTQRAQVVCKLNAKFRIAATGTPVENHLLEFWSIFAFLNPGLLGTQKEFSDRFMENGFATKSLKRIVEPFVLRRLKRDVLTDLPEKIEVVKHVALGEEELSAYEALRRNAVEELQTSGETDNRISILAALTRLRRFCCHPSLVMPEMTSSTKLDAVMDLLEELRESGHRALVFSQFVDYLKIVRDAIAARGWMTCYLDGSTAPADRAAAVDAFQRGAGDFFLISLKAGGTGLNLTAANDVLLLDPWWNPAVEDQAADRAHRIGQKLPVTVYRIVAEGTVEDRILDLHADKRAISDDMMNAAKGAALTPDRLMSLLNEL